MRLFTGSTAYKHNEKSLQIKTKIYSKTECIDHFVLFTMATALSGHHHNSPIVPLIHF